MRLLPTLCVRMLMAFCVALLLSACSSGPPPAPPAEPVPEYWGYSRTVETTNAMITLFDPKDLLHHRADPDGWYRQGFAFRSDLATGRFAAVLTGRDDTFAVRVTSAPLSEREQRAAGPQATQRLRVVDRRLLLAGGDAWPSLDRRRDPQPDDARWMAVSNGDYRVTITILDGRDPRLHDMVIRLEEVDSIDDVAFASGMPQLVIGREPTVVGNSVADLQYRDQCGNVPASATWSPLIERGLPLPGAQSTIETIERLHDRGHELQGASLSADERMIIAQVPNMGSLGVLFVPERWLEVRRKDELYRELFEVEGLVGCAVRITGVSGIGRELMLEFDVLPAPRDRLPDALARRLADRFESHVAVASDPAWRYKSGWVRHAPDDASLVLGVMRHLELSADEIEALLPESNAERARLLLDRMASPI